MNQSASKNVIGFAFIACGLALTAFLLYTLFAPNEKLPSSDVDASPLPVVVIDAGHGGADGGAVSADGTLEKDLNLQIAKTLAELMKISGYNVVMTRTDDSMLTSDSGGSHKMQDLKARLEISSKYPEALTISIHCNKFPMESCKGLQVYYSEIEYSKKAADCVQSSVISLLQNDNHRATKKADSSIYLLDRAKSPSILIECGFLSNPEECEKLSDTSYQKKLALCILNGIQCADEG